MKTNNGNETTALITDIQRFCMHDGPGIRTTVFFKGCPLRCKWCHNPETQAVRPEMMYIPSRCISCGACAAVCERQKTVPERVFDRDTCTVCGKCASVCPAGALCVSGRTVTVGSIIREAEKDRPFYGKQGGLTVSGGEPTMQPAALLALLGAAKEAGFSTALETCGVFPGQLAEELCRLTDLFLFDVKDTDAVRLKENTGADAAQVLRNLYAIDRAGAETVLRCILIPDVNLTKEHCRKLADLYRRLSHCKYIELLPYHPYGTSKAEHLGMRAQTAYRVPERVDILAFASALHAEDVPVKGFGRELDFTK